MSSGEKVLDFPTVEVSPEENATRVTVEATRLASLAPGEWRLWIDRSAERLRIPPATLQGLIVAIIKDNERKARQDKAEARRQEERTRREQEREQRERKRKQERIDKTAERNRKEKEKAFERLISLPSEQHEARLTELARRLDEDSLPFAMISQRSLAWRVKAPQQAPGTLSPGRSRSRLACSFKRSSPRFAGTSCCALKRRLRPRFGR
jgi:hypothetical protein